MARARFCRNRGAVPSLLAALVDLAVPALCPGCDTPGTRLCADCRRLLGQAAARPLGPTRPSPCPPGLPPLAAAAAYAGPLRELLVAHKERSVLRLTRPLGAALAAAVRSGAAPAGSGPLVLVLVPVPSSRASVRERGADHAWRLAAAAASGLRAGGQPACARALLRHSRRVADQAGLDSTRRAANLAGALRAAPDFRPPRAQERLVLVDDVVTTGATLTEAARALAAVGRPAQAAAVVAATQRRTGW